MIKKYNLNPSSNKMKVFNEFSEKSLNSVMQLYQDDSPYSKRKLTRGNINKAINNVDLVELRKFSNYSYYSNNIYSRAIDYFANMLCYYWMITPRIRKSKQSEVLNDEILDMWWDALLYIEDINPESVGPYIARKVLLDGACYVAVKEKSTKKSTFGVQYLPINYCRVKKRYLDRDVIDFNVKYFDDKFSNPAKRLKALEAYPECISKEYYEWKRSPKKETDSEWRTIDPDFAFRFTIRNDEIPYFIGTILDLLDLQDVKDITMFKLEQELSKIIVQHFGMNNDGQPVVDMDILKQFHTSTSNMLSAIPGVDVITTYADVDSIDLQNSQRDSSLEPVTAVIDNVYNSAGISRLLFNADNAGTLAKSIIIDENVMFIFLKQFRSFLKARLDVRFKKGKVGKILDFGVTMPEITYFNRADMIKVYKEQASLGYSKFLPAIATGQRQTDIMSLLVFENDILDLVSMMKPPASSNTTSATANEKSSSKGASSQKEDTGEQKEVGRPKKSDDEISEKTIKNKENI